MRLRLDMRHEMRPWNTHEHRCTLVESKNLKTDRPTQNKENLRLWKTHALEQVKLSPAWPTSPIVGGLLLMFHHHLSILSRIRERQWVEPLNHVLVLGGLHNWSVPTTAFDTALFEAMRGQLVLRSDWFQAIPGQYQLNHKMKTKTQFGQDRTPVFETSNFHPVNCKL